MNSVLTLLTYRHNNGWAFTDNQRNLVDEPFVFGADTWIDKSVSEVLKEDRERVLLTFSVNPLPKVTDKITLVSTSKITGSYYFSELHSMQLWLCPALFKFYDDAPETIYVYIS